MSDHASSRAPVRCRRRGHKAFYRSRPPLENMDRRLDRVERLAALAASDRDHLARTIGEAALDLWSLGVSWPDLVERCLEAIEEEIALGFVPVHVSVPGVRGES